MVKRKSDNQKEGDQGPSTSEAASKPKKNRVHNSAVHQEYDQTETVTAEKKTVTRSVCKHCVAPKSQVFPHKQCSELKRHLKVCHPDVFKKVELFDLKQVEEKTEVPKSRLEVIQDTMNSWMNIAGLRMDTCDHPMFRKLIGLLDDTVPVLGRKGQLSYSYNKFLRMEEKMKDILGKAVQVHLTIDLWSSKAVRESYIGITCSLFDVQAKCRRNFRLCLRLFEGRHTGDLILEKVVSIMDEFQIKSKVRSISTDTGANIKR